MKNNKEIKKICLSILVFIIVSVGMSFFKNVKINALEEEKSKATHQKSEYKGDCVEDKMGFSDDDIVIKIINKIDSSLDINYINKFDKFDKNNKPYSAIELSVSGDLEKIKEIENVLNDLKLNYNIENMDIKNPKTEKGKNKNYVDCLMIFKVI